MRTLTRNPVRWAAAAVAGVCLAAGPASAFYWMGWPGSGLPQPRDLVPPAATPRPYTPPTTTDAPPTQPQFPPPDTTPPDVPGEHPPPSSVPEPTTAALGLLGLAAVGWWRRRR
jgi:MYXO-CTERM domain-containing protein